jgi:hypothetical protein
MKPRGRLYLVLLLISIAIRTMFYFFLFEEGSVPYWVGKTDLLYDVIFFAAFAWLLELLKDRRWLIGLTWITFIDSVGHSVTHLVHEATFLLTERQYSLFQGIMSIPPLVFYLCIVFARKSPARPYFRVMALLTYAPLFYIICAIIFHLPDAETLLSEKTQLFVFSILENLLLVAAMLRTPELRRPKYADFLKE